MNSRVWSAGSSLLTRMRPAGRGHAHADLLVVLELQVDVDFLVALVAVVAVGHGGREVVAITFRQAVVDQHVVTRHLEHRREELDLLGGVVGQRGRPAQRVQVILEELLLLKAQVLLHGYARHGSAALVGVGTLRLGGALHIARDQLEGWYQGSGHLTG